MPQIWMTDGELAAMLACTVEEARERVQREGLDRKPSRDGKKRVKLNTELTGLFIERLKSTDGATDRAIANLRQLHALLSEYELPGEPVLPAWLRVGHAG